MKIQRFSLFFPKNKRKLCVPDFTPNLSQKYGPINIDEFYPQGVKELSPSALGAP